ncbi:small ribosomal subunit protein mS40 [Procambarus clarkii]|uniref:small ribosomal subunit protein mS40 n=1 Tax=Procambarus clarkii TaxID=6728 RepID=UPI001E672EC4|nr:28S ribosomal protein S18b, mitochondrial-like [Procambarus clarkii]
MFLRSLISGYRAAATDFVRNRALLQVTDGNPIRCSLVTSTKLQCKASEEETMVEEHDPTKDRSRVIPLETSLKYMKSEAYQTTYGSEPVWKKYRRNFKGGLPPRKTRKTCIRGKMISTGNPCPICRDEFLVLDYRNVNLLNQFIAEHTGAIISYQKTNLCQRRHKELQVAVEKARDYGLLTYDVPLREYDYSEYYNPAEHENV